MEEEDNEFDKELVQEVQKVFGILAVDKITTIFSRYELKIKELKESRANWRKKYEDLKSDDQ